MAHPTVNDIERVSKFTVVASQDTFNITWPVFQKDGTTGDASLDVYVDGVLKPTSEWSFSGTFTNGVADGGNVVFATAITSGTVVIVGNMPAQRTSDYAAGGFNQDSFNTDLDRIAAMIREAQLVGKRSLKIPAYEDDAGATPVDQVVPALASRANKALGFDASGRPTVIDPDGLTLKEVLTFDGSASSVLWADLSSTARRMVLRISHLRSSLDAALQLRVTQGGVFQSGLNYEYSARVLRSGGSPTEALIGASGGDLFIIGGFTGPSDEISASHGWSGTITFDDPNDTTSHKHIWWEGGYQRAGGTHALNHGSCRYSKDTNPLDGFRAAVSAGNFSGGRIEVWEG